jgi:competence protein ComEA
MNRNRRAEEGQDGARSGVFGRIAKAIAASPWAGPAAKALIAIAATVLLAVIGSGKLRWLAPPIPEAAAATAAPAIPSATAAMAAGKAAPAPIGSGCSTPDEPEATDAGAPVDGGEAKSGGVTADGKVVLNLASEEDLRRLPGIGPTRAKAILALRARLGKFHRPEDLLRVKGLGRRSLARLRPLVLIDAP